MLGQIFLIILFGLLAFIPPYFGFLYPNLIIKNIKNKGRLFGLGIIIVSLLINYFVMESSFAIIIFSIIYIPIIISYFALEKINIGKWDKALLTTLFSLILLLLFYHFDKSQFIEINNSINKQIVIAVNEQWKEFETIDKNQLINTIISAKRASLFMIIFLQNLFTLIFIKDKDKNELHYIFAFVYIISFFYLKFYQEKNLIMENLSLISQQVYGMYGIKELYLIFKKFFKMRFLSGALCLILYIKFPIFMFVLGAVMSFKYFTRNKED